MEVIVMTDKELAKKNPSAVTRREHEPERAVFVPAADIWETPEAIVLRLDMPGVEPDAVDVKVERGTLIVDGKVTNNQNAKVLYAEQRSGDFHREFSLSDDLDTNAISARMNAGVLTLTVAKAAKVKPRKIAIAAG